MARAIANCGAQCSLCGNDILEDDEVCDGDSLDGETCQTQGFDNGSLACAGDCSALDTSGCGQCGDGVVDPAESCDGVNLDGASCASQGFSGGTLACTGSCGFDTSGCTSTPSWATDIQPIWNANCGCHGFAPTIFNVAPGVSYGNTVNVASGQVPSLDFIEPNSADNSYIVQKLEGTAAGGGQMPPAGPLPAATINLIRAWIDAGAPNN